jgi:hypothetical protein
VPTPTFGVLFGFLVVAHDRRRVLHFNLTANPEWTARQLVQAFPEEENSSMSDSGARQDLRPPGSGARWGSSVSRRWSRRRGP